MRSAVLAALMLILLAPPLAAQDPQPGLTIISPLTLTESFLIDLDQNVVKTWHGADAPAGLAYLLLGQSVLRPSRDPDGQFVAGGMGGHLQIIDSNDVVVWDYFFSNAQHQQHHDVEPMPNGNVLLIAWEYKSLAETIAAGRTGATRDIWPTLIAELEPVGATGANVVWEWHLWDHLIQDADPTKDNYGVVGDHPELVDINYGNANSGSWDHANSVDYNQELDQIVFSCRAMSEFYVIDHSTTTAEAAGHTGGNSGKGGDILYRWGNPQVYRRGTGDDQYYFAVHGANWIEPGLPGAGGILTFNNGNRPGTDWSSVEEIHPPMDVDGNYIIDPGEPFGPAAPSWSYSNAPSFHSTNRGGAFRMPNGNTLICESADRRIFEINPDGTTVWVYLAPAVVHMAPRYWGSLTGVTAPPAYENRLLSVQPNPFNPRATIAFELANAGRARLELFDSRGRLVDVLLDRSLEAGLHRAVWAGRDLKGSPASSGVYFYQLSTPGYVDSGKMTLAR